MSSRQRAYQKRRIAEGKCANCGKPRNLYSEKCDECYAKSRERQRRRLGLKAWQQGSRGRPPKDAKENQ